MKPIIPNLWFDDNAEEAMNFYTSVFKDSKVGEIVRYTEVGPGKPGRVLTASFELMGIQFVGINGGPHFKFTEAVSFAVPCESQDELDYYWDKLGEGGQIQQCGWLKDRFGLSWQIVPAMLPKLMSGPDRAKANRVMQAVLQMKKLDIAQLEAAAA